MTLAGWEVRLVLRKVTVLNGIPGDGYPGFEEGLAHIVGEQNASLRYESFTLREMSIRYCCGCWACWVKTPGECAQKDDMPTLLKSIIGSDLTVFVSPVTMGFVSAYTKQAMDKLVPLIHPYIGIVEGEHHHHARYEHYPRFGLILIDPEAKTIGELGIVTDIFRRTALNIKTKLAFAGLSDGSAEVLRDETGRVEWISQG